MYTQNRNNVSVTGIHGRRRVSGFCLMMLVIINVQASSDWQAGANTFLKYCSGCHGQDGFAAYEHAPSFSMGDRLQKDDRELLQSVLNGKNGMPPWQDKLPVQDLRNAIAYIRLMHERHMKGESPQQGDTPGYYYLFKPVGEQDINWKQKQDKK